MRRMTLTALTITALALAGGAASAQSGPPHEWAYGMWTGGLFPTSDGSGPNCTGSPTVIITRDVVFRVSALNPSYHQRIIETVAQRGEALEFRFLPAAPVMSALGPQAAPDAEFGCEAPNFVRVERRGPDEIAFPNCRDFPAPLRRCVPAR